MKKNKLKFKKINAVSTIIDDKFELVANDEESDYVSFYWRPTGYGELFFTFGFKNVNRETLEDALENVIVRGMIFQDISDQCKEMMFNDKYTDDSQFLIPIIDYIEENYRTWED